MALSPEDRAYYHEKLGWRSFIYLCLSTIAVGIVGWPLVLYGLDWSSGQTASWNFKQLLDVSFSGFMMGTAMSVILFFLARFYLWMGWLPSRH